MAADSARAFGDKVGHHGDSTRLPVPAGCGLEEVAPRSQSAWSPWSVMGLSEAPMTTPKIIVWSLACPGEAEVDLLLRAMSSPGVVLDGVTIAGRGRLDVRQFADTMRVCVGLRELRSGTQSDCEHLFVQGSVIEPPNACLERPRETPRKLFA
jgi:hypothetical protein